MHEPRPAADAPAPEAVFADPEAARERMAGWARLPAFRSRAGARDLPPARARADAPARRGRRARTPRSPRSTPSSARLPSGVQLFALMQANPPLLDLLVDICGTAPELARYLGAQRRGVRRGDQQGLLPPAARRGRAARRARRAAGADRRLRDGAERRPHLDEGAALPHRRAPAARPRRARGGGGRLLGGRRRGDRGALADRRRRVRRSGTGPRPAKARSSWRSASSAAAR